MRFICDNCKAKYSIADHKIQKKVLKIRCKKCSHVIIVRDTSMRRGSSDSLPTVGAVQPRQAPAQAHRAQTQQQPLQGRPTAASPSPFQAQQPRPTAQHTLGPAHQEESDVGERTVVARISADWFNQIREQKQEEPIWFMALQGQPVGPVVKSEVLMRIKHQELGRDDLVWCAGWPDWVPAGTVDDLQMALRASTPPPVAPPVKAAPPPVKAAPPPPPKKKPAPKPAAPFQAPAPAPASFPSNGAQQAQTQEAPRPFGASAGDPFGKKISPFDKQPSSQPFGSPFDSPAPAPQSTPLAAQSQVAPRQAEAAPSSPSPWDKAPGPASALQSAPASSQRSTPAEVLAAAPAPQPPLSELTPAVEPPSPAPPPNREDIAHVNEARPAVEFVETSAEEGFFDSGRITQTQDDLLELALPPLPNWEQDAEEIDADDIIEIQDAIRPRWGKRLALSGGVLAAIFAFSFTVSHFVGAFDDPIHTKNPKQSDSNDPQNKTTTTTTRKYSKTGSALLGQSDPQDALKKKKKSKRRYYKRRYRPSVRRVRVARVRPRKRRSTSSDIHKEIMRKYRQSLGGTTPASNQSRGVTGTVKGGSALTPSLKKRIFREIESNKAQVKYCYEQYLKKTYLSGRLVISIKINKQGGVDRVAVLTRRFRALPITKCIERKMRRWRFASFSGTPYIKIQIPYLLQASGF